MKIERLKELQNYFLTVTQQNPNIDMASFFKDEIAKEFEPSTIHRLEAYRISYFSRIRSVFSETIFGPASYLFGPSFIKNFLVEYFLANPNSLNMLDSVRNFPAFLREQEDISFCLFVPDFVNLCLLKEDVLSSANPIPEMFIKKPLSDASLVYLQQSHILFSSAWPVFQMYNAAQDIEEFADSHNIKFDDIESKEIDEFRTKKLSSIKKSPESVLLFKSSPVKFEIVFIPKEYLPIVKALSSGLSLENAIENSHYEEEEINPSEFSQWIAMMTQNRGLVLGS